MVVGAQLAAGLTYTQHPLVIRYESRVIIHLLAVMAFSPAASSIAGSIVGQCGMDSLEGRECMFFVNVPSNSAGGIPLTGAHLGADAEPTFSGLIYVQAEQLHSPYQQSAVRCSIDDGMSICEPIFVGLAEGSLPAQYGGDTLIIGGYLRIWAYAETGDGVWRAYAQRTLPS